MRPLLLVPVVLLLAACGVDRPPAEFKPASGFDCGSLVGDWEVSEEEWSWIMPSPIQVSPPMAYLSIERDQKGALRIVQRPDRQALMSAVSSMRSKSPDDYAFWRASLLGEPTPSLPAYSTRGPMPTASKVSDAEFSDCKGGWRHTRFPYGPNADGDIYGMALALSDDGSLLIAHHLLASQDPGWQFFGQSVGYYTYSHSRWHKLRPVSAQQARFTLSSSDLPPTATSHERLALDIVRRSTLNNFPAWLRDHLPPSGRLERLVEITPPDFPDNRIRFQLLGTASGLEPFSALLATQTDIHDIQVKTQPGPEGGDVLVEFTIQLDPSH